MRKRIFFIAGYAPSLINFRGHLIASLRARGHHVTCAAPCTSIEQVEISSRLQCDLHTLPLQRAGLDPLADLQVFLRLVRLIRSIRPQVIIAYTAKPVVYGGMAARLSGVEFSAIITGLGWGFTGRTLRRRVVATILRMLYTIGLSKAKCIFFQNPDDRQLFYDQGIVPVGHGRLVAGSGVDLSAFSVAPVPIGPPRFLLIARLLADKGIRVFAAAARTIHARYPQVECRIVGPLDPNPAAILAEEIEGWVSEGILSWPGAVDDVRSEISACTVYVLPSYYGEGVPRTVLEAMSMGRPIITTNAPGCRETVVDGDNGFLVAPRSEHDLAAAMEKFIVDPTIAAPMGLRSRAMVELRFNVHRVNASIISALGL